MSSPCIQKLIDNFGGKRVGGYDVALVPNFMGLMGGAPDLQQVLVNKYPIRKAGDEIVPEVVQWVHGTNSALKYRGNVLAREKIWLQRGPVTDGYAYYFYTGVQWRVVLAQTDWRDCPEVGELIPNLDGIYKAIGAAPATQAIITRYRDQDFGIGKHYDKPKTIAESTADAESLISVVKMGEAGRPFNLYKRGVDGAEDELIWSEVVAPGDAIIMTLEANLLTKHEVPIMADEVVGDSGSIVFRTISSVVPYAELQKKIAASERAKEKANEKKVAAKRAREDVVG